MCGISFGMGDVYTILHLRVSIHCSIVMIRPHDDNMDIEDINAHYMLMKNNFNL